MPGVRAAQHDQHGVRLLLTAYEPQPPAVIPTDETWVAVADQLGRLHHKPMLRSTWLRRRPQPSSGQTADALNLWAARGLGTLATRAATRLGATRDLEAQSEPVLTHGDCHLRNLLHGPEGQAIWIDWQDVCLATGWTISRSCGSGLSSKGLTRLA